MFSVIWYKIIGGITLRASSAGWLKLSRVDFVWTFFFHSARKKGETTQNRFSWAFSQPVEVALICWKGSRNLKCWKGEPVLSCRCALLSCRAPFPSLSCSAATVCSLGCAADDSAPFSMPYCSTSARVRNSTVLWPAAGVAAE